MAGRPWETGDENARWDGYLIDDGRTLRNLVGASTPRELRQIEDDLVEARALTLREHGLPDDYDLDGLRSVHHHLFQDVYEWAGEVRTVALRKGTEGWFASLDQIAPAMDQVAEHLRETSKLRSLASAEVPRDLADVYNIVNHVHPFREGNGRTQREFVTALARESGHHLDWTRVTRDRGGYESQNDQASREARSGDPRSLYAMFDHITVPAETDSLDAAAFEAVRLAQTNHHRAASFPHGATSARGTGSASSSRPPTPAVPSSTRSPGIER